jgi:hypothetical protein
MNAAETRRPIIPATVMAVFLRIAIQATIVSIAVPQTVGRLRGINLYSWIFSSDALRW